MRRINFILIFAVLISLTTIFVWSNKREGILTQEVRDGEIGEESATEKRQILHWTCSMHPQVREEKPGECPICGMRLIPIYRGDEDKIIIDEETRALLDIRSQPVEKMYLTKTLHLPGKVANDNDLYLAQQEYLTSLHNFMRLNGMDERQEKRIREMLEAAKFRLSLFGYNEKDIKKLEGIGEPDGNLIFPGKNVWLHGTVYEYDLHFVKLGQRAIATTPAFPGKKFYGIVRFVEPILNTETRSAKARIEFENQQNLLKLEMYANLEIKVSLGRHLAIPQNAVIDTGARKVVYVDLGGGRYEMKEVKTGFETEGFVQILDGLKIGDLVVVNGNFILDSQSTLTGGQSLLYGSSEEIKEKLQEGQHRH